MRYYIEPRTRKYVKGYGFLSLVIYILREQRQNLDFLF